MVYCPRCGSNAPSYKGREAEHGYERVRVCATCDCAFLTEEAYVREVDVESLRSTEPSCCADCSYYRPETPENNCIAMKSNKMVKDDMCGLKSAKKT